MPLLCPVLSIFTLVFVSRKVPLKVGATPLLVCPHHVLHRVALYSFIPKLNFFHNHVNFFSPMQSHHLLNFIPKGCLSQGRMRGKLQRSIGQSERVLFIIGPRLTSQRGRFRGIVSTQCTSPRLKRTFWQKCSCTTASLLLIDRQVV